MTTKIIKENDFEREVLDSDGITIARFFGSWCGPCKMQSTILKQMENEKYNSIKIVEIDIDKSEKLTHKYGIMTVPTLVIFKDGAELEKIAGFRNQKQLEEIFDNYCDLEK